MKQKLVLTMMLLLSLVAPFATFADSFKVNPVDVTQGETATLEFTLENSQPFFGFQADVTLPAGLTAGAITLSDRANDGNYWVDSNLTSSGILKIAAFSQNNKPFSGNDGVLVNLEVAVDSEFKGGTVEIKNIIFTKEGNLDENLSADTATIGVAVSEITLNEKSTELKVGESVTLLATVTPGNATDSSVTWTSSNTNVATVDAEGKVIAIAYGKGTVTITATTKNGKTATCEVTVIATPVESITLSSATLSLKEGAIATLKATINPSTATDKTLTWSSNDETVATVSAEGVVTAVKDGTATITVTSTNGKTATCNVTVAANIVDVTSISIDKETLTLTEGDNATLTATVAPSDATDKNVTWTSSDESIATVSTAGVVTALKAGTAIITAASSNAKTATCAVTVNPVLATKVTLDKTETSLKVGESVTLSAVVAPENTSDKTVTWKSSDETIASVVGGKITAKALGEATITATCGSVSATCKVSVVKTPVTSVTLDNQTLSLTEGDKATLTATVAPTDATYKTIAWTSSAEAVATVDANGKVTAVAAGSATITATADGVSASCEVTVAAKVIAVTGVTLDKTEAIVVEGETVNLTATVTPENATDKTVTWATSDAAVATVENGVVKAVKAGTATITAKAGEFTATCAVTVTAKTIAVTGVTLAPATLDMTEGDTATLTATIAPNNATDKTITWATSDEAVATVKDGVVTAVKAGKATITVTAGDKTATCEVTVAAEVVAVTGVTLDKTVVSLFVGETETLKATVAPEKATDKSVTWSSSDENIATVANGVVTAVKAGTATITVTASGFTASCKVTVKADNRVSVPVKMTYVNKNDADKAYGEIAAGETAEAGYNKISGGSVAFANEGWNVNFITYLQVNVSEIKGTLLSAALTFDASGSTDSKRNTGWGAGYNSSVWSSDMTYNTADKTITTVGEQAWTATKSAATFENLSIDITEAVKNADADGMVTILIYETNAGGGYIKNPVVLVEATEAETYAVTFKETNGVEATVILNKQDVTKGASLIDGTYDFTATAKGYKEYTGEFTVAGKALEVEFTMTPKDTWNWTVKNNVNNDVKTGTCLENEPVTVPYSRYIIAEDGTVWKKEAAKQTPYTITINPDKDGYETTIEYSATDMTDGLYFKEAENIEGMTEVTGSNANIRCSNAAGGYASEAIEVYTLPRGTYKVTLGVWGNAGSTFVVKADADTIMTAETTGSWHEAVSEEFTLDKETALTFEGATASKPLDYILITGTVNTGVAVTGITLNSTAEIIRVGESVALMATVTPADATDPTITWTSSDPSIATVDAEGNVTAKGVGKATITASAGEFSAKCSIKCYPQLGDASWDGAILINDATDIANFVVEKKKAPSGWNQTEWLEFYKAGANVNGDEDGLITFADASAAVDLALDAPLTDATQRRISTSDDSMDALVISGFSQTADGRISIPVALDNTTAFVALQADIILPEGVNVEVKAGSRVAATHEMKTKKFADNHVRVALFNFSNSAFADNAAPVIEIIVDSNIADAADVVIANIFASDADAIGYALAVKSNVITGVEGIESDDNAPVKVYDLNGRYISDKVEGLQGGIYIIRRGENAKKVRIR
ncbi:MAG: Ig-like domain-containing protein [Muribaculaceae bacterium]|nr:Ig-like domain-containing protein [Muribaculaceae bacterium]